MISRVKIARVKLVLARQGLREICERREELQTCLRSKHLMSCFSTRAEERFDQTLGLKFVVESYD